MVSDSTWTVTWFVSGKRLERKKYLLLFLSFWVQLKVSVIYCCRINRSYACTSVFISVQAFVHSNICAHLYLCRCTFIFVSVFTQMCSNCTHIFTSVHIHVQQVYMLSSYLFMLMSVKEYTHLHICAHSCVQQVYKRLPVCACSCVCLRKWVHTYPEAG